MTQTDRAPRCLRLTERSNGIKLKATERCESEQVPGSALCAHHLAEAAREYQAIISAHTLGETS
jgi:hypothetical protein